VIESAKCSRQAHSMDDAVVITATGVLCSLGDTAEGLWPALLSGKGGIRPIEGFKAEGFNCRSAAQAPGLNPSDLGIGPREARLMNKQALMLMKCAKEAFFRSGLNTGLVPKEEIGFFGAMGMVDYEIEDLLPAVLKSLGRDGTLNYDAFYRQGYQEIYPLWPLSMLNNVSFCQTAISLGIKGENTVFSPHGDSGVLAVAEGANTLIEKKSRVVVACGVSEKITPLSLARGHLCGILAVEDGANKAVCRPFDARRRGTVLGEGCGAVALELETSARERGLQPLALISGYGFACEPEGNFAGPTSRAFSLAMISALAKAGLGPSDIDAVIAHGDSTASGDQNEIAAINQVFAGGLDPVCVFSSKGALGHLLAGAPLVDIILGLSMLEQGIIPMTLNSTCPDPAIGFRFIHKEPLRAEVKRILINSQSYEGQAASLVIESPRLRGWA